MKSKLFFTSTLILLVFPLLVSADIIMPGTKYIDYCYQIKNINDYGDYTFIADYHIVDSYDVLNSGECYSFYKLDTPTFYAIETAKFFEEDLAIEEDELDFFASNMDLMPASITVDPIFAVDESDPRDSVADVLEITALDEITFALKKASVVYTYSDGTTEELDYIDQDIRPEPTKTRKGLIAWRYDTYLYIFIPLLALIIIVVIIVLSRRKKKV